MVASSPGTERLWPRLRRALPAPIEIHRLASLVHRPVQVDPLASHLYLSFIPAPATADGSAETAPTLLELGGVMLHPAQNGRVYQANAALAHHGHQIAIAQLEAPIPAHAQHHDLSVKMATFEQLLDRYESWHLAIIADSGAVCTRAGDDRWAYRREPARTASRASSVRYAVFTRLSETAPVKR